MNVMELNDTDVKILQGLLEDARFSSRQIAKNVGVSVGTVPVSYTHLTLPTKRIV